MTIDPIRDAPAKTKRGHASHKPRGIPNAECHSSESEETSLWCFYIACVYYLNFTVFEIV